MNPELLKLYKALQPFFRERMGRIGGYDSIYPEGGPIMLYKDLRGDDSIMYCKWIIIPRTIDDSSPEAQKRSLWGMLDWENTYITTGRKGEARLYSGAGFVAGAITEAILRTLCAQEGVEV